jgi:hypothetical protein
VLLGTAESALKLALAVKQFVLDRNTEAIGAVISLIAGDPQKIKDLGGDYAEAFSMAAEVLDYAAEEWEQLSDGKKGYYMGRLIFEIVSCFCGAAIAKVATKAQFVTKLVGRPFFQSGKGAGFASKLVAFVQRLFTTKMCFVAGTLVMTQGGLQPIETLRAGEVVWSRNEVTHAEGWQPVVDTFTTHPETLHTLRLDADGDGAADAETLTCTGEHPFWVVEEHAFVPAAELRPGWHLLRAHGSGQVTVLGIESTRAPPEQPFTTYNFEMYQPIARLKPAIQVQDKNSWQAS